MSWFVWLFVGLIAVIVMFTHVFSRAIGWNECCAYYEIEEDDRYAGDH